MRPIFHGGSHTNVTSTSSTPGTHWVEIMLDKDLKLRFPLRVGQVKQRPVPPDGYPGFAEG